MSNKKPENVPEIKKLPIDERVDALENAMNAIIMYLSTIEKWRRMEFKPPETGGKDEKESKSQGAEKGSEPSKETQPKAAKASSEAIK